MDGEALALNGYAPRCTSTTPTPGHTRKGRGRLWAYSPRRVTALTRTPSASRRCGRDCEWTLLAGPESLGQGEGCVSRSCRPCLIAIFRAQDRLFSFREATCGDDMGGPAGAAGRRRNTHDRPPVLAWRGPDKEKQIARGKIFRPGQRLSRCGDVAYLN